MIIIQVLITIFAIIIGYLILTYSIALLLANFPRRSVNDYPDWGITEDLRIPTAKGKKIESWIVYPKEKTDKNKPAIILVHGWGRNRGRMVSRARIYGEQGYTTILISVRDHGKSDKEITGMSILKFSQDLDFCVNWWGKPVIITGHSIGAGASLIVAGRNSLVKGVIAEAPPYAFLQHLKYVYKPILKWSTPLFLPGIKLIAFIKFRNHSKEEYSPLDAAPRITVPTLLIHGKDDDILPHEYTYHLQKEISHSQIWIPDGVDHYNIEEHPDYANQVIRFIETNFASKM
ncbi:MAG: alpha/beta hydrolase [Candidatus Hodarchaeota archaeon]